MHCLIYGFFGKLLDTLLSLNSAYYYVDLETSNFYFSKFTFCKKQKLFSDISKEEISLSVLNVEYNS